MKNRVLRQQTASRGSARRRTVATFATSLGLVLGLAVASPAAAAIQTGTKGCGSQYGWLTSTSYVHSEIVPPGSYTKFVSGTGGTYTLVATNSAGYAMIGGGKWGVEGSQSASGTPFCRTYG